MTDLRKDVEDKISQANQECAPDLLPYAARRLAEWSTNVIWSGITAALAAARADGLAEAAAIVEGQGFDAVSDVLWKVAEDAGWKVP